MEKVTQGVPGSGAVVAGEGAVAVAGARGQEHKHRQKMREFPELSILARDQLGATPHGRHMQCQCRMLARSDHESVTTYRFKST